MVTINCIGDRNGRDTSVTIWRSVFAAAARLGWRGGRAVELIRYRAMFGLEGELCAARRAFLEQLVSLNREVEAPPPAEPEI